MVEMVQAHRRMRYLYDISKVLTAFQSVERTIPEVVAIVADAVSLRGAIFVIETGGTPRATTWQSPGESPAHLRAAQSHAQSAYSYLVASGIDFVRDASTSRPLELPNTGGDGAPEPEPGAKPNFVMLPLAVDHAPIFGALQVEGATALTEVDLVFVNAVVNQLAIAVDRHVVIGLRQASAEANEKEQRLLAAVSASLESSPGYRHPLAALARLLVSSVADMCIIDEVGDDGAIRRAEVLFADEKKQGSLAGRVRQFKPRPGWQSPQASVIAARASLLFSRIVDPVGEVVFGDPRHADLLRAAGVTSMMAVPLRARGKVLGVLTLGAGESGRRYSTHDLTIAEEIARRAGIAMDNATLYQQAQFATIARENLLALVSHDLRNLLTATVMNVQALLMGHEGEDRRSSRKQLLAVLRSTDAMTRLIGDLLDGAQIDRGRFLVNPGRLEIGPIISEVVEASQPLAARKSQHLINDVPNALPVIRADGVRLQQVLANLVGNAIKFTPEGGSITLRARSSVDEVSVAVIDTGPGIRREDVPRLFDRFWQARPNMGVGTGLGLFIAKGIVEAHGGKIWVESETGRGTTVFVSIPVASSEDATSQLRTKPSVHAPASGYGHARVKFKNGSRRGRSERHLRGMEVRKRELKSAVESTRVARELAERASEYRHEFMDVVSHELRGPLTALELLIERIQRDPEAPPTLRQQVTIRRMFAAVARSTVMVESLLQHALIQSGRLTTHLESFNVQEVASEAVEEMRPYAEGKALALRLFTADGLPPLCSDPALVRLILQNLVANALKSTQRGFVEVVVGHAAGTHSLVVKDSGPGIRESDSIRIFDPLMRARHAKQESIPGMGLGLALVREVASALGGHVALRSEAGRGSTFTVTLPSAPEARRQGAPPP